MVDGEIDQVASLVCRAKPGFENRWARDTRGRRRFTPDIPERTNPPAESFLTGMHTLARGWQAKRWLPRVCAPNGTSFLKGMHMGDLLSTRPVTKIPCAAAPCLVVHASCPMQFASPRGRPAPAYAIPTGLSSVWGP